MGEKFNVLDHVPFFRGHGEALLNVRRELGAAGVGIGSLLLVKSLLVAAGLPFLGLSLAAGIAGYFLFKKFVKGGSSDAPKKHAT